MYRILKKTGSDTDNLWSFYLEAGVVWETDVEQTATSKMETLAETTPVQNLRLVQNVEFSVDVTITVPDETVTP